MPFFTEEIDFYLFIEFLRSKKIKYEVKGKKYTVFVDNIQVYHFYYLEKPFFHELLVTINEINKYGHWISH